MSKKQDLNTSCRATFKDGHTQEFASIEEASESTGISVASIKIRCNKQGCGGKDKTLFEWLDEHTKRSYQAKKSRNKGAAWEYEVIKKLKELGYDGCVSARGESKKVDNNKIDVIDTKHLLPINVQCKQYQNTPSYFSIREACSDKSKPFCLAWKKSPEGSEASKGSIMMVPIDVFYELLDAYTKHHNILK